MQDTTADYLPRLETNRPTGPDLGKQVYCPDYRGLSIANLPASVCRWLGVEPLESAAPPLVSGLQEHWGRSFRNVVVLLLDGFGLDMLQRARQESQSDLDLAVWQSLPESALLAPLTSVVPSTTAAALTSLWSGALPAEHGVIGYEVFLKEYSLIANMLRHTPASYSEGESSLRLAGFDPLTFLPVPLLGPHLARQGVRPYAFLHRSIAFSSSAIGFSKSNTRSMDSPLSIVIGKYLMQGSFHIPAMNDQIDKTVLKQELRCLKIIRKLLFYRLLDNPTACKPD